MIRRSCALLAVVVVAACGGGDDEPAIDAAGAVDAGVVDAAVEDAPAPDPDAGPTVCPLSFAGCSTTVDRTGMAIVMIDVSGDFYAPACVRVSAGTQVRIEASDRHPLRAAPCSAVDFVGAGPGGTTVTASYTVADPGTYGYWCTSHGTPAGEGMAGLIVVE